MGELVPHNGSNQLVIKKDYTYANYDGITLFQSVNGEVGLGAGLDEKTLALARRGEPDPDEVRFMRKLCNGFAGGSATFFATLAGIAPFVNESPVSSIVMGTVLSGALHAESYLWPSMAKKRRKAIVAMSEGLTQIPARPIPLILEDLPEHVDLSRNSLPTQDLVSVLQGMQVQHLSSEAAAQYQADNPRAINPAMIVKSSVLSLTEDKRGAHLQRVFDRSMDIADLATSLYRHAPLAVTTAGKEGLRRQTTELLGHLGEVACSFVDLKAAEIIPKVENLIDIADEQDIHSGLSEARHILDTSGLSVQRYQLATRSWGDAGTL